MKKMLAMTLALSLGGLIAGAAEGENKPKPVIPAPGAPPAGVSRIPEAYKKYDKNGDGKLDEEERKPLQMERQALAKQRQEDLLKKYDKNTDGQLDEAEKKVMLEDRKKERDEMLKKRQAQGGPTPTAPVAPAPSDKK